MTSDPADVLRPLRRTRQVREFEPTLLAPEALDAIADVARWTGSSKNTQPWRFIVITDPSTIRAIHVAGLPQTRGLASAPAAIAIVLPAEPERAVHDAYDDGRVAEGSWSRQRCSTSVRASAGFARMSGRRSPRSSNSRRIGWSGRSSSWGSRPRRPGPRSPPPARRASHARMSSSASAGRPIDGP